MKRVIINRTTFDFDRDVSGAKPVASFLLNEGGICEFEFGEEHVPTEMSVVDVVTGRPVTLDEDPERWAELLPSAYRSGDYWIAVTEVTS